MRPINSWPRVLWGVSFTFLTFAGLQALQLYYIYPLLDVPPSDNPIRVWSPLIMGGLMAVNMLAFTVGGSWLARRHYPASADAFHLEADAEAYDRLLSQHKVSTNQVKVVAEQGGIRASTPVWLFGTQNPAIRFVEVGRQQGRVKLEGYLDSRWPVLFSNGFDIRTHHALSQLLAA